MDNDKPTKKGNSLIHVGADYDTRHCDGVLVVIMLVALSTVNNDVNDGYNGSN
jgi:hypothetical protein